MRGKFTEEQKKEIIEKYKNSKSKSILSLANEYICDSATIRSVLNKNNINILNYDEHNKKNKQNYLLENTDNIINLYINKIKTVVEIAKLYNVRHYVIKKLLTDNNITVSKRIYIDNENYFEKINTKNKAYILGFIYADGGMSFSKKRQMVSSISLSLNKKDTDVLEFIKGEISPQRPIKTGKYYSTLNISNIKICNDLINKGVVQAKTFKIRYPKEHISDELFWDFLRGYFDGDGCFYIDKKNRSSWSIISNILFIKDIQEKLLEFNINSYVYINSGKNQKISELRIHEKEDIKIVCDNMHTNADFFFKRKFNKFQLMLEFLKNKQLKKENYENIKNKIRKLYFNQNISGTKIIKILNTTHNIVYTAIRELKESLF